MKCPKCLTETIIKIEGSDTCKCSNCMNEFDIKFVHEAASLRWLHTNFINTPEKQAYIDFLVHKMESR